MFWQAALSHPLSDLFAAIGLLALLALVAWRWRRSAAAVARARAVRHELAAERDLLEAVFAATSDAILVLDEDFRVLAVNETAADRFGRPVPDMIGCDILALTDPAIVASRRERYRQALDTGKSLRFGDVRDGRALDNTVSPLPAGPAGKKRLAVYARDVSHEVAARRAVEESRDRLEKLLRLVPAVIAVTTLPEGRFLDVNETFSTITGYARDDVIGRNIEELGIWLDPESNARIDRAIEAQGLVRNMEIEVRFKDGRPATGLFSGIPLEAYGQPCLLSVMMDITGRKAMEHDLRLAKEAAEAASQTQSRFLSLVSHEIRTPLNTILGMVDLLRDSGLAPGQEVLVRAQEEAGEHLLRLFSDILDVTRIQSGRLALAREPYDPCELAHRLGREYAPRARAKGLDLTVDTAPDAPRQALGDPARVGQVLGNLLDNAVKFTPAGTVRLTVGQAVGQAHYAVADTGIGIPEQARAHLFEPFTQLDASTTRAFGGTGLGLALCALLCRRMGGQIRLESAPGAGSTFHVTLPLRAAEA
ncbi:MAG: PAS domain-containing sensor histidine kinase [Solidesulfovibrio sp. DCME]|uniref:PAS domain-containing sensor histidine kinase n=1 Tax=Solidesulfovibrio sp. DCME TaxID=3447380 RepID=UPI003D0E15C4